MRFTLPVLLVSALMLAVPTVGSAMSHKKKEDGEKEYQCDKDKKGKKHSFADMDSDDSGGVSADEFIEAHKAYLMKKFEHMDADGNGEISETELKKKREMMKQKMQKRHGHHDHDEMEDDDD